MGAVQSLLHADSAPATHVDSTTRQRLDSEQGAQSRASSKILRDMTSKFSELELLSLRQVVQQLKTQQDAKLANHAEQDATTTPQKRPAGITEDTFAAYISIGPDQSRAEHL
ncbi:hypothetical protein BGZ72_000512, partial [Mortierella alpina]